ncbi:hypothetical protein AGMMS50268_30740 [Spirochaetia bacterium]|nr:hypothetical protein AGMMS50268_30740 [Spirochaetia bacterium]
MVTITLNLPADVEDKAQKQGLLSPAVFESFIRKSLGLSSGKKTAQQNGCVCPYCGKTEHIPNATTIAAMQEIQDMIDGKIPHKHYHSMTEVLADLHQWAEEPND